MTKKVPRLKKGLYRHNKTGQLYEVIGIAHHSETDEIMVVYRPHSYIDEHEFFVRPYSMWQELVSIGGKTMPRFEPVETPRSFLA